ncbi:MAG: CHAT domain-containing protein [Novosphingobium sp.]|nr:CHAT domain-containing protein [Novosphingobium sp.]
MLAKVLKASASSVLTDSAASKAALFARNADGRLARVRVLEFATHGLVAGEGDGLSEPSLVLAAASKAEDWLLTASEAATLKLNTDWVLLSACNTGSPDGEGAEGLSGLTRGFFAAGANALLVSHWTVDATAVRLVPDVIARHAKGLGRAEALRQASLAILDDKTASKANPYYWATFALIGEPK